MLSTLNIITIALVIIGIALAFMGANWELIIPVAFCHASIVGGDAIYKLMEK